MIIKFTIYFRLLNLGLVLVKYEHFKLKIFFLQIVQI